MNLDSKHRLICDDSNFILRRRRKRKKNIKSDEWQTVGYWKDLGQALQAYSRCVKRASLPSTWNELLQLQHALRTQIEAIGERCVTLWGKGS